MEILLTYKADDRGAADSYISLLPTGLISIHALLRTFGYQTRISNLSRYSWHQIKSLLASGPPDILGVSQFTHNRFESLKLTRIAKEVNPGCFVVLGGPHASHCFHNILSCNTSVDAIVLGEGEETFAELVKAVERGWPSLDEVRGIAFRQHGKIVQTPPRPLLAQLDTLPLPAASFDEALGVDPRRQLEFIITSRGCPAFCSFCSSPSFWGRTLRFRSPRSIVDEIRYVRDRYGLIYFSIRDDTFTSDKKRVVEFCRLLLREKIYIMWNCQSRVNAVDEEILVWMKRAGCECVQFGVESGSSRVLETLGKGITREQVKLAALAARRVGIRFSVYLITGVPKEDEKDLKATLALLDVIKADDGQVSPLAYYPGTRMFEQGVHSGAVSADVFEKSRAEAVYVRSDRFVEHAKKELLTRLERVAAKSSFGPSDFAEQKKFLGFCHATNVMAGELFESKAELQRAEDEYREITDREPDNPWGWLMTGELYAGLGKVSQARQAFENLLRLVPSHAPAFLHLGHLSRIAGDIRSSRKFYREALKLDPFERSAKDGLKSIGG